MRCAPRFFIGVALVALSVPVGAASQAGPPHDFRFSFVGGSGAIAESWTYTITVTADGQGELFHESWDGTSWTRTFSVPSEEVARLWAIVSEGDVMARTWEMEDEMSVGGGMSTIRVDAGGLQVEVRALLSQTDDRRVFNDLSRHAHDVLPGTVFTALPWTARARYGRER